MTESNNPHQHRRLFWILLAGVTVFRLFVSGWYGLSMDESHYLLYARNLSLGYFDHPPMVAWLGALTTAISEHPFFVRLGPILCASASVILLRRLALAIYGDEKIALWGFMLLLVMPVQHVLAMALLPDATLNLFWCAALLAAWRALKDEGWGWWILMGALFGGALLSKYHGVLFPLCLFGYVVSSRETRRWLRSPKPYVAGLVGLVVFSPNILWNYQHEWISYAFQAGHGGGSGNFSIGKLVESIGGQLGAASPVLLVMFVAACIKATLVKPINEGDRFALWTSLPVLVFFCGIGLFGKILPHWPAVAWWSGVLLFASVLARLERKGGSTAERWRRWIRVGAGIGLFIILVMHLAIGFPVVRAVYQPFRKFSLSLNRRFPSFVPLDPYKTKFDITNDLYGWEQTGRWVEGIKATMPNPSKTFVFCHRFFTTSQLAVYLKAGTEATSLHRKPSQYRLWFDPQKHVGWDALFVDDNRWRQGTDRYLPFFERVDAEPLVLDIYRKGEVAHNFKVFRYYGYKGKVERKP